MSDPDEGEDRERRFDRSEQRRRPAEPERQSEGRPRPHIRVPTTRTPDNPGMARLAAMIGHVQAAGRYAATLAATIPSGMAHHRIAGRNRNRAKKGSDVGGCRNVKGA